jgi:histidyl-tRNA synthetase
MREANKFNSRYVIFFGGDEYASGNLSLKNMQTSEQKQLLLSELDNIMID